MAGLRGAFTTEGQREVVDGVTILTERHITRNACRWLVGSGASSEAGAGTSPGSRLEEANRKVRMVEAALQEAETRFSAIVG